MKAIILAAGEGTRMARYTQDLPKGMLPFGGRSLIAHQIWALREAGISEIAIVTGYRNKTIKFDGISLFHNADFATTNMVASLMVAEEYFTDDILVTYADLLYTPRLVKAMQISDRDIALAVDPEWRKYWLARYGTTETDLETLTIEGNKVLELGSPVASSERIDYRYVGLVRFRQTTLMEAVHFYHAKRASGAKWKSSGNTFAQGYMTDILSELIDMGTEVAPVSAAHQWLEFDTAQDYELAIKYLVDGGLNDLIDTTELKLSFPAG